MKFLFLIRLAPVVCIMTIAGGQVSACKCASNFHGKNAWEVAKLQLQGSTAVFEGTPEHIELQWSLLKAKVGDLIPTNLMEGTPDNYPRMVVTFRVLRAYKGYLGPQIQISTGLGGGDCGATFAPGLTYLVYADGPSLHELTSNTCSPGGWIGNSDVAVDLRYMRNDRPVSTDLVPYKPWWTREESAELKQSREREFEEIKTRYEAATGKICGTVALGGEKDAYPGIVSFLSTKGYSPVEHPTAGVRQDGTFCSDRLGPGKYYLYFMRVSDQGLTSAVYYPGVSDRTKAMAIEISPGLTLSDFIFKAPVQRTYSVHGFISTNDKPEPSAKDVSVVLINVDEFPFQPWYMKAIDFSGSFPLPKVKYVNFENVLPGRYVAYISGLGPGWLTKKVEVNVSAHMKFIDLELVHKQ